MTQKSDLAQKQREEEVAKEKERALEQMARKKTQEEIRKQENTLSESTIIVTTDEDEAKINHVRARGYFGPLLNAVRTVSPRSPSTR